MQDEVNCAELDCDGSRAGLGITLAREGRLGGVRTALAIWAVDIQDALFA